MRELGKTSIIVILVLSLSYSFILASYTYSTVSDLKDAYGVTGDASAQVNLCINTPPSFDFSSCPSSGQQGTAYACQLIGIDPEQTNLTFFSSFTSMSRTFSNSTAAPFSVNSSGYGNFTPSNSDVGSYTAVFTVNDNLGCSNSLTQVSRNLTINNTNDAPILRENIPNLQFGSGGGLTFFLSVYFSDPDLDTLNYTVSGNNQISIVIESSSRVSISAATCGITELVLFSATDPYNESATSNPVEVTCTNPVTSTPSGGSSGGGGGGGGGGISTVCRSEYECYDYYMCNATNQKLQRCVDTEGCKRDEYLTVPCNYQAPTSCVENWACTDWAHCQPEGIQYRNCTDASGCSLPIFMPALSQTCKFLGSCSDGILNCHDGSCEEGIDCGGPCDACSRVEVPYLFPDERGLGIYFISSIIMLLLVAALIYQYFRKEINAALAKAGWLIKRRKSKQFLLKDEDKKKLLTELRRLEKRLAELDTKDISEKRESLLRFYLMAVVPGLAEGFTSEHLAQTLEKSKKRVNPALRKIFSSMFWARRINDKREAALAIEELRNIVVQTSRIEQGDIARAEKEIKILPSHGALEASVIKVTNTYIALEFEQLDIAKKKYLELLTDYESMDVKTQEQLFETIARLYTNISYVNSWLVPPVEP